MNFQSAAVVTALAWGIVFALLQVEHAKWADLDFRVRYVMGMGTVCLGCVGAGIALDNAALAIVPGILATAGLPVLLSYASEEKAERERRAARQQGEIVGMAKGIRQDLTQAMIDRGGDRGENDPRRSN